MRQILAGVYRNIMCFLCYLGTIKGDFRTGILSKISLPFAKKEGFGRVTKGITKYYEVLQSITEHYKEHQGHADLGRQIMKGKRQDMLIQRDKL